MQNRKVNRNIIILMMLFFLFIAVSCDNNKKKYTLFSIEEDYSEIAVPLERWQAYNLSDYSIDQSITCECYPPHNWNLIIINNKIENVNYEYQKDSIDTRSDKKIKEYVYSKSLTVDGAFSLIQRYTDDADYIKVEYDEKYGYPTWIYIDIDSLVADEEIIRRFSNLKGIE